MSYCCVISKLITKYYSGMEGLEHSIVSVCKCRALIVCLYLLTVLSLRCFAMRSTVDDIALGHSRSLVSQYILYTTLVYCTGQHVIQMVTYGSTV